MSDLLRRVQKARSRTGDLSLPKWQRLWKGLEAFSGLELTGISEDIQALLETGLARVNRLLTQYPLETHEDYQIISDVDLQQVMASSR